ncbi:unnamed protein product [Linum trigynum]|uniref:Uncharacterized protein n=1 Tax=Linum trigynum TaxID=586398 RepID=A0AAV2FTD9_9ROSI
MDPNGFYNMWGYPQPPKWGYLGASWSNQESGSQGTGFYDQPPFQEEQAYHWGFQEAPPYEENLPPQVEEKSKLELAMEAFMAQPSKSKLEFMVERFSRGTDEECSNMDLPQPEVKSKLELAAENVTRTSSNTDFQPLPPPGLTLLEKVERACASYHLSLLEENEEVERASNDNHVEQDELTPENSRGEDEQEGCIDDPHHLPLPESNLEDQDTSVEEQENPFYELAWRLALQSVLEDMNVKKRLKGRKKVLKRGKISSVPKGRKLKKKEGRLRKKKKEHAVSEQWTRSRWMNHPQVTCAMKAFHQTSMRFWRRTRLRLFAKPSLSHQRSPLVDAMEVKRAFTTWCGAKRRKKKRSHGWSLKATQGHEPSIMDSSKARDLRHHLTDESLNFKEVLGWTET